MLFPEIPPEQALPLVEELDMLLLVEEATLIVKFKLIPTTPPE